MDHIQSLTFDEYIKDLVKMQTNLFNAQIKFLRRCIKSKRMKQLSELVRGFRHVGIYDFLPSYLHHGRIALTGDGLVICYFKELDKFDLFEVVEMTDDKYSKMFLGDDVKLHSKFTFIELKNLFEENN